jgi:hypothetical protein
VDHGATRNRRLSCKHPKLLGTSPPLRKVAVDRALRPTMTRAVQTCHGLPSSVGHCLLADGSEGEACVPADHVRSIEDLHSGTELLTSCPGNPLDRAL